MKTIYKYELEGSNPHIEMPYGSKVLCVQMQGAVPCIWAEVDPDAPLVKRSFRIVGTGHSIDFTNGEYIGTFQMHGGTFIWHLYELI